MSTGWDLPCAGDGAAEYVCIGIVAPFFFHKSRTEYKMDIESLKIIAETVNALGSAGKEAFIWYVATDIAKYIIGSLSIISVSFFVTKAILIGANSDSNKALREIGGILGLRTLRDCNISYNEIRIVVEAVRALKR